MNQVLSELIHRLGRRRWKRRDVPDSVTLVLESTVVVRYGAEQAGAETGYNPKNPGRSSHRPLLAFTRETDDLIGLRWRPGSVWAAGGVTNWPLELVSWLRETDVEESTARLYKSSYAEQRGGTLQELEVFYLLKVLNHGHVRDELGLDTYEVTETAHVLTNKPGIHALTAWRSYNIEYNAGAVVKQRSMGPTAVDDFADSPLLWALGGLAYQLLHLLRSQLSGAWKRAQPERLRTSPFRTPAMLTRYDRKWRVQLTAEEFSHGLLPRALPGLRAPPA